MGNLGPSDKLSSVMNFACAKYHASQPAVERKASFTPGTLNERNSLAFFDVCMSKMEINENNWDIISKQFDRTGALTDIIIKIDNNNRWLNLIKWLEKEENKNIRIIKNNIYNPISDKNLNNIPGNIQDLFHLQSFYLLSNILFNDIEIVFHCHGIESAKEVELDFDARELKTYDQFCSLLDFINEVANIVESNQWFISNEMDKENKLIIKEGSKLHAISIV